MKLLVLGLLLLGAPAFGTDICGPSSGPAVITEPGEYTCSAPLSWPGKTALFVQADDVTVLDLKITAGYTCVSVVGRSRVRFIGGTISGCTKIAFLITGTTQDVAVEGLTITDSGNGALFYTTVGNIHDRLRAVNLNCARLGGAVDGHCVGVQSATNAYVAGNHSQGTQRAAISFYWPNGTTEQHDNVIEFNSIDNIAGTGISLGGSNGEGKLKYSNIVRYNRINAFEPLYLKGNPTPATTLWAVEATDNFTIGPSRLGRATNSSCPRVYHARSGVFIGISGC